MMAVRFGPWLGSTRSRNREIWAEPCQKLNMCVVTVKELNVCDTRFINIGLFRLLVARERTITALHGPMGVAQQRASLSTTSVDMWYRMPFR